jgi:16S rRNA (cytidine1402-2'-O)-methyltransferase
VPAGVLYVCAVPIGNGGDASPRLRTVLGQVGAVACEDTRTTGRLLEMLEIVPRPRLLAHHDHNEEASAAGIVALLQGGVDVALVSDAGTPAVSDPGAILVRAAHAAGIAVVAVPGPSSVATAVAVSGAIGDGFRFCGFLPRSAGALQQVLEQGVGEVLVALESPRRLRASLEVLERVQPERIGVVCRELTKVHEQVVRGTAGELLEALDEDVRGEVVLVLDVLAGAGAVGDAAGALALARDLVGAGLRQREAARIATRHMSGDARTVYDALSARRDA